MASSVSASAGMFKFVLMVSNAARQQPGSKLTTT